MCNSYTVYKIKQLNFRSSDKDNYNHCHINVLGIVKLTSIRRFLQDKYRWTIPQSAVYSLCQLSVCGRQGILQKTRGPWALTLCLRTNLAIGQSARSCTYTLFLPQGGEIELIFALRAAVSEIQASFQNCHIWA